MASNIATPTLVHSTADFITPISPKLLVKLPVRKVAEVKPHKILGQPTSPSATNFSKEEEGKGKEGKEEMCLGVEEDRDWEVVCPR